MGIKDQKRRCDAIEDAAQKCSSEVYQSSLRTCYDAVPNHVFGGQFHVIKVNSWRFVRFAHYQVHFSETMINDHIEFRPNPKDDSFLDCYRNFAIAEFVIETGELIHRNIRHL